MGFLDAIRGRKAPARPHLDALFALPSAAVTLDVDLGLAPTGVGSVCFRSPEGRAFSDLETRVRELLDADGGPSVEANGDEFGFDWLTVRTEPADSGNRGDRYPRGEYLFGPGWLWSATAVLRFSFY